MKSIKIISSHIFMYLIVLAFMAGSTGSTKEYVGYLFFALLLASFALSWAINTNVLKREKNDVRSITIGLILSILISPMSVALYIFGFGMYVMSDWH